MTAVLTGLGLMLLNAAIALEVPTEVIAGFNVDGLAMIAMAVGALIAMRALLGSGSASSSRRRLEAADASP